MAAPVELSRLVDQLRRSLAVLKSAGYDEVFDDPSTDLTKPSAGVFWEKVREENPILQIDQPKESPMKKLRILAAVLASVLIPFGAISAEAPRDGEALVHQVWSAMKAGDSKALGSLMAPGFQSVHEDGARDRAAELELIKGLNLEDYLLSGFKVTQAGDVMIVTYQVSVGETIDGKRLSKAPAMRMSVFVKLDGVWRWAAHANLKPIQ